jgi:hypothetical protein
MPAGLQVSLPWWAVAGGLLVGGGTVLGLVLDHLGKLDKYKPSKAQEGEYGPDRVTLADFDYARNELGPIITPMEWLIGVPLYARAHRDYRMELAAEVAEPNDAGVPDTLQPSAPNTLTLPMFTLGTGEIYTRVYGWKGEGHSMVEFWLMTDGSQQSVEKVAGTRGNKLYKQAKAEGHWPIRALTADEKAKKAAFYAAGPPAG